MPLPAGRRAQRGQLKPPHFRLSVYRTASSEVRGAPSSRTHMRAQILPHSPGMLLAALARILYLVNRWSPHAPGAAASQQNLPLHPSSGSRYEPESGEWQTDNSIKRP